ncbi:hypothetical protein BD414DRAFT_505647 [Trametes punicea]|nr:hypothetical protein BD414DRAFT_505647 [Trametes punicea]
MAAVLTHSYSPGPGRGILLNPSPAASPAYPPSSLPALVPSNSSLSSSASSSSPGEDYFSHSPSPSPALAAATISIAAPADSDLCRRTRSLPPSVTNSPCPARKALPADSLLLDPAAHPSSASDANDADAQSPAAAAEPGQEWDVVQPASPALPALSLPLSTPESPRKSNKWSKMLKPLLGRSSNTKSSLTRTMSAEEIAAMNGGEAQRGRGLRLGLSGSRNSSRSRDASVSRERDQGRDRKDAEFGLPLHRWTSEGQPILPVGKKKKNSLFGGGGNGGGVPLGRTQSLTSLSGSKDDRKAAKPVIVTNGGRKQQRMLNGRVYGAKRNANANPFANVRSEEPEFVEWGYGGMGSVKSSAGQSQIWSRVQKGNVAIGGGDQSAWGARSAAAEEDDGSGMAWVKRRRQQREREQREREEREKAEAEARKSKVASEIAEQKDADEAKADAMESPEAESEGVSTAPTSATATVTASPISSTPLPLETPQTAAPYEEHITQTVSIPAPTPHHRHHHSHSHPHHHHGLPLSLILPNVERRESADTARGLPFVLSSSAVATPVSAGEAAEDSQDTPIAGGARLRKESITEGEGGELLSSSATSTTSTSTTSEDIEDSEDGPKGSEGGYGEGDEDEEEEEEEEEQLLKERSRLTALGAGVEKIARHKEHDHEQASPAETHARNACRHTASCTLRKGEALWVPSTIIWRGRDPRMKMYPSSQWPDVGPCGPASCCVVDQSSSGSSLNVVQR